MYARMLPACSLLIRP